MSEEIHITYEASTLIFGKLRDELAKALPGVILDPRTQEYRCEAQFYRAIIEILRKKKIPYHDAARGYPAAPSGWKIISGRVPHAHQSEAVEAWWRQRGQGLVVLPTGAGKTFTAILAIAKADRPALVVTPTIDLLNQWYSELTTAFGVAIGLMGGGHHELQPITVTTYDSASIYVERWGNRFGMLVFDECHHLPGPSNRLAAVGSIAPFRLGLTATPERADGQESAYEELIGPTVYRREIKEFAGELLAEYNTQRIYVELSPEEQAAYQQARETYRKFVSSQGIYLGGPDGWKRFLWESSRSEAGRQAFRAYRMAKSLERAASAKLAKLGELLEQHAKDRVLIFTADNATVYQISRRYLVPAITHQTKVKERKAILRAFHTGEYNVLVTSQVLNEGVDVPAAGIGIVLSGSGTVRENVQRLGRLLRKYEGKQAQLYEVVAQGTSEEYTSDKRRQHGAFR